MTDRKKPLPPAEYSAFRALLDKVAKVPKTEVDEKEREFRDRPHIKPGRKRRAAG